MKKTESKITAPEKPVIAINVDVFKKEINKEEMSVRV